MLLRGGVGRRGKKSIIRILDPTYNNFPVIERVSVCRPPAKNNAQEMQVGKTAQHSTVDEQHRLDRAR
jgi:hypothetical protein